MPELPEVETIRRMLQPELQGRKIVGVRVLWERTLATPSPAEVTTGLPGQRIVTLGRRGKYLLIELTQDVLLIHLRMSGDLVLEPQHREPGKHHRFWLDLDDDRRLVFSDARKFGRVWVSAVPAEILCKLGPEPFDTDLTAEVLYNKLKRTRRQLKPLLLDQTFLAGLGNIYCDEALHLARLHPQMPANRLTLEQSECLLRAIHQVLQEGIRRNGASIDWVYRGGEFQNYFRAYQRTGHPCPVCGTIIERLVVGQRGTHICPNCQQISLTG